MPSSRGKGRQSIPVVEEIAEERLPVNTRFPPRSAITPTVQVLSNVEETTKKISVKRPSLELVDSQSFNRGDKGQSKGIRVLENEFSKEADVKANESVDTLPTVLSSAAQSAESSEATTSASEVEEPTTQIMDKVALDLYAYLAHENSNIDSSTGSSLDEESSTATESSSTDELTTLDLLSTSSTTTTTTTTTTQAPTTTTTTTTEAAAFNGRRSSFGAEKSNRFKGRSKPTVDTKPPAVGNDANNAQSSEATSTKPKSMILSLSFYLYVHC